MKTVLQDLIEGFNVTPDETFCEWLREQQNNLLEKEKKQMLDFGLYVKKNGWVGCKIEDLYEDYYNQNKL